MDFERISRVLEICLPVFAMIGLGKLLAFTGFMKEEHRQFINKLVYYFSLPSLIFIGVAGQDPKMFMDAELVAGALLPIFLVTVIFMVLAKILRYKGSFAAAFVFGAFYSNSAYVGFPLSRATFGEEGFGVCSVYNAVCIPIFLIITFTLVGIYGAGARIESPAQRIKRALLNPFIITCVLGAVTAFILNPYRVEGGTYNLPGWIMLPGGIIVSFMKMIAKVGLPLALVAIGGVLHIGKIREKAGALCLDIFGKLILIPALSLLVFMYLFPDQGKTVVGTLTLTHAMPNAVVAYVISCQIGVDESFVSSQLALSTLVAILTIPVWVYFLLGLA